MRFFTIFLFSYNSFIIVNLFYLSNIFIPSMIDFVFYIDLHNTAIWQNTRALSKNIAMQFLQIFDSAGQTKPLFSKFSQFTD